MHTLPLRIRPGQQPAREAAAWLIAGEGPHAWLAELASWNVPLAEFKLLIVPRSRHDRQPQGALAIGPATARPTVLSTAPRALPYAVVAERLYLPLDARFDPPVSDAELAALLSHELAAFVWHPAAGLVGFETTDVQSVAQLLAAPPRRSSASGSSVSGSGVAWDRAQPGPAFSHRLLSIEADQPPTLESVFEQGRDDIGSQSPHADELPPSPQEPSQGAANDLGRRAKQAFAKAVKSLTNLAPRTAAQPTWINRAEDWAQRQLEAVSRALSAARQRELLRLLNLLETEPDQGLKYALPLADSGHRGVAPPSARLGEHDTNFSLGRLGGGRAADAWDISYELQMQLCKRYRELAAREIRLGRHRRAAYILAELLGDLRAAASTLTAGNHWREAAVLYRDRLNSKQEAAECLEKGGLWSEAIALHEALGNFERCGDLHAQLEQPDLATVAYRLGVERHLADGNPTSAARLLEVKLAVPEEALAVLEQGWPQSTQARQCLQESFGLLARLSRHEATAQKVRHLGEQQLSAKQTGELVEVLAETAAAYPNPAVKHLAADTARVAVARRLPQAAWVEVGALLAALRSLAPEDRLLAHDCQRYATRIERPAPSPAVRHKLRLVRVIELDRSIDWQVAASAGDEFYLAGYFRDELGGCDIVRCDYQGSIQSPAGRPWRLRPPHAAPLFLAPDPRGTKPVIMAAMGKALEHRPFFPGETFARTTSVGTPDWLPLNLFAISRVPSGLTWALYAHEGKLVLGAFDDRHTLVSTREVDLPPISPIGPPGILALHARHDGVYLGYDEWLVEYRQNGVEFRTNCNQQIHGLCGSAAHTRRRVVAMLAQGCAMSWDDTLELERFALDLHHPVAGFTTGGCVVVAARGKLEVYACQQSRLKLVLEDDYPATPLAVFEAPQPNQFTLCDTNGQIRIYELPRLG